MCAATSAIVAFVDDDAAVEPEWLASLLRLFETREDVLGAGGPVVPRWGVDRRWFPDELLWVVGCTYRGHREEAGAIRNAIGCNMAFRRLELIEIGGFAAGFGKRGNALATCDETELSLRVERVFGRDRIWYVPEAKVRHFVPGARISWRLLVRRSLSEGLSKGRLHGVYGGRALRAERGYARRLLVDAVPRLLRGGVVMRDRDLALGAAGILVSLLLTTAAFVAGRLTASNGRAGHRRLRPAASTPTASGHASQTR